LNLIGDELKTIHVFDMASAMRDQKRWQLCKLFFFFLAGVSQINMLSPDIQVKVRKFPTNNHSTVNAEASLKAPKPQVFISILIQPSLFTSLPLCLARPSAVQFNFMVFFFSSSMIYQNK
jgi:hypothetical protein